MRLGRSIAAIVIGFVACVILSLATDQILHILKVYPPWGQPMWDPALNLLALTYRCIFTVATCYLTARLAPRAPMRHAMILGGIGFVISCLGVFASMKMNLGPTWYPVALAASTLPCAWLGGALRRQPASARLSATASL